MKKIRFILSVLLTAVMLASCAGQSGGPQGAQSPAQGGEAAKIVMATEAGFAPYEYYSDDGEVVGVDPDIAKAIAEAMGATLEIQEMEFNAIINEVKAGRADFGAAGLTISEERKKEVDFSIPYATSKQIIVARAEEDTLFGPNDLGGRNVGVQFGTVADYELTDSYPDVSVERYNKYFEAVADLENGRIDAIVMDILPAQEFVAQNQGLKILEEELLTDEYAICVRKGNTELLDKINAVLEELISSGKIEEFTVKHTIG